MNVRFFRNKKIIIKPSQDSYDLNQIVTMCHNNSSCTDILFIFQRPRPTYFNDSLKAIATFIKILMDDELLPNLEKVSISVGYFARSFNNLFSQIINLCNARPAIYYFGFFVTDSIYEKSTLLIDLLNNSLSGLKNITDLNLDMYGLSDLPYIGHLDRFKSLNLNFPEFGTRYTKQFVNGLVKMIMDNWDIETLSIARLHHGFLIEIINALRYNQSLKKFDMRGYIYADEMLTDSIANLIKENKSINTLCIYIPTDYRKIVDALFDNDTLKELTFYYTNDVSQPQIEGFLSELVEMLKGNFTILKINRQLGIGNFERELNQKINEMLAENNKFLYESRFNKTKPIILDI